jgi:hypothetical protein
MLDRHARLPRHATVNGCGSSTVNGCGSSTGSGSGIDSGSVCGSGALPPAATAAWHVPGIAAVVADDAGAGAWGWQWMGGSGSGRVAVAVDWVAGWQCVCVFGIR